MSMRRDLFSRARVLVVGDAMLDRYWFGEVSRISPEAPVPVVQVNRIEERLGGAANVARNAAALGARAYLLSVVGQDEAGDVLARLLEQEAVGAGLSRDPDITTTVKLRVIGRQQQLLRMDFEARPTYEAFSEKLQEFHARLEDCDCVVLSDYGKGGLTHFGAIIESANQAGKPVLVDPKGDDWERYRGATLITPNLAEFRQVAGNWLDEAGLAARAQGIRSRFEIKSLLLTRGEGGMTLFDEQGAHHQPAEAREVYDVTGAGDTVIATMAVALAAGLPQTDAMRLANRAAGVVVGKFGTAVATPEELF